MPLSQPSSFTASQNILFLSMAEFRADKGVEGSEGSDMIGFGCQIGGKSSLWVDKGGQREAHDFSPTSVEEKAENILKPSDSMIAWIPKSSAGTRSGGNETRVHRFYYLVCTHFLSVFVSHVSGKSCCRPLKHGKHVQFHMHHNSLLCKLQFVI